MMRRHPSGGGLRRPVWGRFLRSTRGAALVEGALGLTLVISASVLALNGYLQVSRHLAGLHATVTVAEYVAREPSRKSRHIKNLAKFVEKTLLAPDNAALALCAIRGTTPTPQKVWGKKFLGQPACSRICQSGGTNPLANSSLTLEENEAVIVAELCVTSGSQTDYYHHIMPTVVTTEPA